jgi:hypothetical protein
MNKFKKPTETKKPTSTNSSARKIVRAFNFGGLIEKESLVKLMPYILFLTILAITYIANSYLAEKKIRNIEHLNSELKELRSEYISTKSDLMHKSKQSEVAKAVEPLGIKESVDPPVKVRITKKDTRKAKNQD